MFFIGNHDYQWFQKVFISKEKKYDQEKKTSWYNLTQILLEFSVHVIMMALTTGPMDPKFPMGRFGL